MRFSSEPIPSTVEPELAEYLDRQFNNIANASDALFVVPILQAVPRKRIEGGVVYIKDDGLYACVSEAANGDAEWKKLVTQ